MTPGRRVSVWGILGLVLHLAVGVFPYAFSGLLVPIIGTAALYVVWLVLAVVAWRIRGHRTPAPLLVPLFALGLWWAVITLGERFLDWNA